MPIPSLNEKTIKEQFQNPNVSKSLSESLNKLVASYEQLKEVATRYRNNLDAIHFLPDSSKKEWENDENFCHYGKLACIAIMKELEKIEKLLSDWPYTPKWRQENPANWFPIYTNQFYTWVKNFDNHLKEGPKGK